MIIISDLRGFLQIYGLRHKTLPFLSRSPFNDSRMRCELQVDESGATHVCSFDVPSNHNEGMEKMPRLPLERQQHSLCL